ncbi:MAG: hypothetical protein LBD67_08585 [Candidatus Accumulibacter sp.]|jgi:hypothetical protein|nr:hypothetical protein [Accumulibacter sp.]
MTTNEKWAKSPFKKSSLQSRSERKQPSDYIAHLQKKKEVRALPARQNHGYFAKYSNRFMNLMKKPGCTCAVFLNTPLFVRLWGAQTPDEVRPPHNFRHE